MERKWLDLARNTCISAAGLMFLAPQSAAQTNPGFEDGLNGWSIPAEAASDISLSKTAKSGAQSLEISGAKGTAQQVVTVEPKSHYELSASYNGAAVLGVQVGPKIYFDRTKPTKSWKGAKVTFNTDDAATARIFLGFNGKAGQVDDLVLTRKGVQAGQKVSVNVLSKSSGGTGLSPELPPGKNFDLLGWNLSIPTDTDNSSTSDTISETNLAKGYQDPKYFYTAPDGGMVFKCPIAGPKTSTNTSYTRTELREMLRRGNSKISTKLDDGRPNKNNWVFSTAPKEAKAAAGGVDGILEATLAVNYVTTTGSPAEVGRVIIGQIHAKDDEPIRLYYRKLPGNTHGSIYAAHENPNVTDDVYYEIIGSKSQSAKNPANGIQLNEKFSYKIDARGDFLYVTISKDGAELGKATIDMTASGYNVANDYMYFKAGVYNQNKSGDPTDYVQATFYRLIASHN